MNLIDGITILNQTPITDISSRAKFLFNIFEVGIGGLLIGFIIFLFLINIFDINNVISVIGQILIGLGIVDLLLLFVVMGFSIGDKRELTGRYQYECIIDDSVSLKDITEQYDIIEHRGDIWILEDKND